MLGIYYLHLPSPCTITVDPVITVNAAICGAVINKTQTINISGGESLMPGYIIELTNVATSAVAPLFQINYSPGSFNLSNVNIPAGFIQPNTQYCIRVKGVNISGGPDLTFSAPCCFTTSNFSPRPISGNVDFKIISSPNPFRTNFTLNIQSSSKEIVSVRVYDMRGKMVDDLTFDYTDRNNLQLGNQYTAGIYTVLVTQGEYSESLRIIKN